MKNLIIILLVIASLQTQAQIGIYRSGFDQVLLVNQSSHSIVVTVGGGTEYLIPRYGSGNLHFTLNDYNVKNTPFEVTYTQRCVDLDALICGSDAEREKIRNENRTKIIGLVSQLFGENMSFERFVTLLKLTALLLGLDTPEMDRLIVNLSEVYESKMTNSEREARMVAIMKSYFDKSNEIDRAKDGCIEGVKNLLGAIKPKTYYASDFFDKQEKSSTDLCLFGVAGFRTQLFRGAGNDQTIKRFRYKEQPSFGARLSFRFNAYNKYKVRKIGRSYYVPITFMQSRAMYKTEVDSPFINNQAFSWQFFSIGFGKEINGFSRTFNARYSILMDAGIMTNSTSSATIDSTGTKLLNKKSVSSFNSVIPYVNVGIRMQLYQGLDAYASYYSTLLYTKLKYDKKDMPLFRQFSIGLHFSLSRRYSYQY